MRRACAALAATVLLAGCGSGVVSGHGSAVTGGPVPSGGATASGPASSSAPTLTFSVTGHAGGVTAVLKVDGHAKSLGAIRLPYTLRVAKTATRYVLTITITGGGEIECEVRSTDGGVLSDSGAGSTDTGTLDCAS